MIRVAKLFVFLAAALSFAGVRAVAEETGAPAEAPAAEASAPTDATAPADGTTVTPADGAAEAPVEPATVEAAAPEAPSDGTYKIVKGDTLWNIANTYLKDPFLWTKIWEANKSNITNPDLIYPDQQLVIPSVSAAQGMAETPAAPPTAETAAAPAVETPATTVEPVTEAPAATETAEALPAPAEKPKPIASAPEPEPEPEPVEEAPAVPVKKGSVPGAGFMGGVSDTFVAGPDWEYDGYILRDREQKMMISQGDVVFLNVGAASGVQPRMTGYIYRLGKKIRDPFLKKYTGKMLKRVGTVMVTSQVNDEGCTAVITNSLEPIRVGDLVKFAAN
ncbi:MAG TPA: LysM peptidoglycan-binding domain-containing protein [Elusimicrobiota bacterium]|nr:LysM peptidoglycan-binding domain-containing protein [Elusimicrobiota bacterium]